MQRLALGRNVIFCAGRSGSTLFRENADNVLFAEDLPSLTRNLHHDPNLNFHLLIRHPVQRFFSGLWLEWCSHILPHWDEKIKPPLKDPMYSVNLYLEQIKKQIFIPDPEHMGNWLIKLDHGFISKCRVWKFEEINQLFEHVGIDPDNITIELINPNIFLPFSYSEMYEQLTVENKIYVNDYLRDEIIRYEFIMSTFYNF